MRKEVLFAIIAGAIFGLVVALGVWRANKAFDKPEAASTTSETDDSNQKNEIIGFELAISEPEERDVVTESPITIHGLVSSKTWVTVYSPIEAKIIKTDNSNLEVEIELTPGLNQIIVNAVSESGNIIEKRINVVYSTEFAKNISELTLDSESNESTESSEVDEAVKDKIEVALNNPKSYIGTITDKTDNTIQIRNGEGQIMQTSVDETTSYIKSTTKSEQISLDDVAIGDYMVAMGFVNEAEVLDAKRILITEPQEKIEKVAFWGIVKEASTNSFVIEETDFNISRTTDIYSLSDEEIIDANSNDIEEDDILIVVGLADEEGSIEAEVIQVVKKAAISKPEEDE